MLRPAQREDVLTEDLFLLRRAQEPLDELESLVRVNAKVRWTEFGVGDGGAVIGSARNIEYVTGV